MYVHPENPIKLYFALYQNHTIHHMTKMANMRAMLFRNNDGI